MGSYGGKARRDMPEILRLAERGVIDFARGISHRFQSIREADAAYNALDRGQITGRAVIEFNDSR